MWSLLLLIDLQGSARLKPIGNVLNLYSEIKIRDAYVRFLSTLHWNNVTLNTVQNEILKILYNNVFNLKAKPVYINRRCQLIKVWLSLTIVTHTQFGGSLMLIVSLIKVLSFNGGSLVQTHKDSLSSLLNSILWCEYIFYFQKMDDDDDE